MAKGLMIVEHTAAIEATLRLDETIGLMADQRSRVAAVLSVVGWRPPALVSALSRNSMRWPMVPSSSTWRAL
jgi:hypothetical protein